MNFKERVWQTQQFTCFFFVYFTRDLFQCCTRFSKQSDNTYDDCPFWWRIRIGNEHMSHSACYCWKFRLFSNQNFKNLLKNFDEFGKYFIFNSITASCERNKNCKWEICVNKYWTLTHRRRDTDKIQTFVCTVHTYIIVCLPMNDEEWIGTTKKIYDEIVHEMSL